MGAIPHEMTGGHPHRRGLADMLTDRQEIVAWAEARRAVPIVIAHSRHPIELAQLSLRFPGEDPGVIFEPVGWSRWLDLLEERRLAVVCRDREPDGSLSREFRLAPRSRVPRQAVRSA